MSSPQELQDRYQFQSWYVRFWRRRHLLKVPFTFLRYWWSNLDCDDPDDILSSREIWSISIGMAHADMKWYYTLDEIDEWSEQDG